MALKVTLEKLTVTITTAGTRVPLSAVPRYTTLVEIHFPTGNSGNVFLGDSSVDDTYIPRAANSTVSFSGSDNASSNTGDYINLAEWYVDGASSGDTVIVQYLKGT